MSREKKHSTAEHEKLLDRYEWALKCTREVQGPAEVAFHKLQADINNKHIEHFDHDEINRLLILDHAATTEVKIKHAYFLDNMELGVDAAEHLYTDSAKLIQNKGGPSYIEAELATTESAAKKLFATLVKDMNEKLKARKAELHAHSR